MVLRTQTEVHPKTCLELTLITGMYILIIKALSDATKIEAVPQSV